MDTTQQSQRLELRAWSWNDKEMLEDVSRRQTLIEANGAVKAEGFPLRRFVEDTGPPEKLTEASMKKVIQVMN